MTKAVWVRDGDSSSINGVISQKGGKTEGGELHRPQQVWRPYHARQRFARESKKSASLHSANGLHHTTPSGSGGPTLALLSSTPQRVASLSICPLIQQSDVLQTRARRSHTAQNKKKEKKPPKRERTARSSIRRTTHRHRHTHTYTSETHTLYGLRPLPPPTSHFLLPFSLILRRGNSGNHPPIRPQPRPVAAVTRKGKAGQ